MGGETSGRMISQSIHSVCVKKDNFLEEVWHGNVLFDPAWRNGLFGEK